MSGFAYEADFDARALAAFADGGMNAGTVPYAPPAGGTTIAGNRRCLLNKNAQTLGNDGRVRAPRDVVAVLLADGAVEPRGRLSIGSDIYELRAVDETDANDGSLQYWVVRRV